PDVIGYLVLRGEASDATLEPLTPTPVVEPRFRDTHVTAGKKYVYAVLALDSRLPVANVSGESTRVEDTAREFRRAAMKLFVDSGAAKDIDAPTAIGILDGVTTN